MNVTFFYRPKIKGAHSIEAVFDSVKSKLPEEVCYTDYICTHKWKRYYSFIKARKHQGEINHITGDIHSIALFLKSSKTIITVHDIGHYERELTGVKKAIFKIIWLVLPLRKVKYITTISQFTKQKLIETCNIPEDKIFVIPNPACVDFKFSPKEFNENTPVILQIGSGNNKNIYRLIDAITGLNFKLLLIRRLDEKLKEKLQESGINYECQHNISRKEVYECYKRCDIVFFASEYEGFGMPILEANAVGRPVVTSSISSMPDVAGNAAVLVDPYSVIEIKKSLLLLKEDKRYRLMLIENGLENLKRFSIEKIAKQYVELYQKILDEK